MQNHGELRVENEFIAQNLARMKRVALAELRALSLPDAESHVEDVVNETCLTILLNWKKINSPEDALNKITAFRARTYARAYRRRRETSDEIDEGSEPLFGSPGADPAERLMHVELIERLLAVLNEEQQLVIVMRFFHELSFEAIAATLDQPLGTVTSRYSRAMRKLADTVLSPPGVPDHDTAPYSKGKDSRRGRPQSHKTWRGESYE